MTAAPSKRGGRQSTLTHSLLHGQAPTSACLWFPDRLSLLQCQFQGHHFLGTKGNPGVISQGCQKCCSLSVLQWDTGVQVMDETL